MDKNTVLIAVIALLAGFISGFLLANNLNRSEMAAARPQTVAPAQAPSNSNSPAPSDDTLSPDEIRSKIAQADADPNNFTYQKNLGIALYRYSTMKSDTNVLSESERILERAHSIDAKDFDVMVALGNALFDIGFSKKDSASFQRARDMYQKALAVRPDDADVRTDLGISYYVQDPPDYARAATELQSVVNANPKHDRSMQFLAQVYIKQNKIAEAERLLAKIKEVAPGNDAIGDLSAQIAAAKSPSK